MNKGQYAIEMKITFCISAFISRNGNCLFRFDIGTIETLDTTNFKQTILPKNNVENNCVYCSRKCLQCLMQRSSINPYQIRQILNEILVRFYK